MATTTKKSVIPSDSQREYEKEMIVYHLLLEGEASTYKEAEEKAVAEILKLYGDQTSK